MRDHLEFDTANDMIRATDEDLKIILITKVSLKKKRVGGK